MTSEKKAVRGSVEDALQPETVKLLETNPEEYVRKTRHPFGFVASKSKKSARN